MITKKSSRPTKLKSVGQKTVDIRKFQIKNFHKLFIRVKPTDRPLLTYVEVGLNIY